MEILGSNLIKIQQTKEQEGKQGHTEINQKKQK